MEMDPVANTAGGCVVTATGDNCNPRGVLAREALEEKQQRTASITDATASSLWAFILADILGVVLRFLPCLADRAAVRSVCRHWRAAAHGHSLPPPLPLLVLPKFRFLSFSIHGSDVTLRRGWMPEEVATGHGCCAGAFDGWLLVARPCEDAGGPERFLVNTFSHNIVHLPRLRAPYCTASDDHSWTASDDPKYARSLDHVVLSAPPGSATKCIVAGISCHRLSNCHGFAGITLWQPGMKTWYVYQSPWVDWSSNLMFHQGKLYMLYSGLCLSPWIFAVTLGEDEHGINVSHLEGPVNMLPLPCPSPAHRVALCNLVQWRGILVVIVRYVDPNISLYQTEKVDVFGLDISIDPCGVTEIHNFGGDCVFVDPCRSTSFPASSYDGVQGDCIYFIDKYKKRDERIYQTTVYNMRDGTVKPFTSELSSANSDEDDLGDPMWMFPPQ